MKATVMESDSDHGDCRHLDLEPVIVYDVPSGMRRRDGYSCQTCGHRASELPFPYPLRSSQADHLRLMIEEFVNE